METNKISHNLKSIIQEFLNHAKLYEQIRYIVEIKNDTNKKIYNINDKYLLKIITKATHKNEKNEIKNLIKLKHIPNIPKIIATEEIENQVYTFFTFIPGQDLFSSWTAKNTTQQKQALREIMNIIKNIHKIEIPHYTIGYHHTAIYSWKKTWIEGHDEYMNWLYKQLAKNKFDLDLNKIINYSRIFYNTQREALLYQNKPKLLHGDLQLHNIIENKDHVAGIVDWEWTHGGEIDFEFEAFFRLALYPEHSIEKENLPVSRQKYESIISYLFNEYPEINTIPKLKERITIYLIEYDLHRLVQQPMLIERQKQRLYGWLEEKILEKYFL
jgi:thiamine kinase-like enzyme